MERLIELVNHLPTYVRLSTTPEFEQVVECRLVNASIMQVSDLVIAAGYQDHEAVVSPDRKTIKVHARGTSVPWSAFTVVGLH
jgi:hypothetical protein